MLRHVSPGLNFWYCLAIISSSSWLLSSLAMDFIKKTTRPVFLISTLVLLWFTSNPVLTKFYFSLERNPDTDRFFHGYESAGKTIGFVLLLFGNVGLYYFSEKSFACILTFLFLSFYCLCCCLCIQPYTDFGILDFLLGATLNQTLSLFGLRSSSTWLVVVALVVIAGLRYFLQPSHPPGEATSAEADQLESGQLLPTACKEEPPPLGAQLANKDPSQFGCILELDLSGSTNPLLERERERITMETANDRFQTLPYRRRLNDLQAADSREYEDDSSSGPFDIYRTENASVDRLRRWRVVRWGRSVYANIQNFIQFQLTVNVAALVINVVAAVSSGDVPLNAVQLLWVNLIMDTLGALALATEPPTDELMHRPPVGRREPLITNIMWRNLLMQAFYQVTVLLILNFKGRKILHLEHYDDHGATKVKNTLIFNAFVFCQIFNGFNARKPEEINIFKGVTKNYLFMGIVGLTILLQVIIVMFLGKFAGTVRLSWKLWLVSIAIGIVSWPLAIVGKLIPVPKTPLHEYFTRIWSRIWPGRRRTLRGATNSRQEDGVERK